MKCDFNTADLLSQLSEKSRKQVELTINALCRSTRKAVRQAETCAPDARESAWQEVDRRSATLCRLLDQLAGPRPAETPAPDPEPVPAANEAEREPEPEGIPEPVQHLLDELEAESQRVAALPRKNIGQVRHVRREETKLLARIQEVQAACRR